MKRILITAVALVLIIGLGIALLFANLERILESSIERYGSKILGVKVSVESVSVVPDQQRATITGLRVANPLGYGDEPALMIAEVSLAVDVESATVNKILVSGTEVNVQVRGLDSNIAELAENVEAYRPSEVSSETGQAGGPVIRIQSVEIQAADARMRTDFSDEVFAYRIDALRFRDLEGTREEIAIQLTEQLIAHIAFEVAKEALKEKARDKAGELGDRLKELIDG